ncbi:hypothetical protein K1719_012101 [Acacia pycnantha]|nr:hypothetical protein K1719_012101 [Acacia pycnantha]
MDKSWIKQPRSSPVYLAGLNTFLDFSFSHACINGKIPFEAYTFWEVHGEQRGMGYGLHLPRTSQVGNQVHQDDSVNEAVRDAFGVQDNNFTAEVQGPEPVFFRNDATQEFFSLMDESDRPLYQGCQKYSKLSFLIKLYHIKCMCGITDKAMSMFLELLRDAFLDADIPSSFYEAKKIINRLGLNYQKIDACPNDCMLYWGEDNRRETCKKCHTSRFKTVRKGKKQKKKPA